MSRRSRKSKRRLNSLFMMLILTGMLLLSSTYAWFSASREVALEGINAKVVAAEGLQISLDGESWSSKITINETNLKAATGNKYQWPTALNPVSTTGTTTSGLLDMFAGEVTSDGTTLNNAAKETELTTSGAGGKYIAFDLYFKNSSSQASDTLQLNTGTNVAISENGKTGTGLENCIRSGIVLYSNKANLTDDGSIVRAIAAGTPSVCIWEPNYNKHIAEVVKNDSRVEGDSSSSIATYGLMSIGTGTVEGINKLEKNTFIDEQKTLRTDANVGTVTDLTNLGAGKITLTGNSIMKARIYIWIEGQDVDCIDTASTGKEINVTLGFTKPAVEKTAGT